MNNAKLHIRLKKRDKRYQIQSSVCFCVVMTGATVVFHAFSVHSSLTVADDINVHNKSYSVIGRSSQSRIKSHNQSGANF